MRWRFLKLDTPYLLGELVIVVLGVLIALGVDNWRNERENKALEAEYLTRLSEELSSGADFLREYLTRVEEIAAAQNELIVLLDAPNSPTEWNGYVSDFAWSARLAGDETLESRLNHDVTYQELINTARFSIINDAEIRDSITRYYQNLRTALEVSVFVPNSLNRRFTRSTGYTPGDYLRADENMEIVDIVESRIVGAIQESPTEILAELRESRAALGRSMRWIMTALAANGELQSLISNAESI